TDELVAEERDRIDGERPGRRRHDDPRDAQEPLQPRRQHGRPQAAEERPGEPGPQREIDFTNHGAYSLVSGRKASPRRVTESPWARIGSTANSFAPATPTRTGAGPYRRRPDGRVRRLGSRRWWRG